MAATGHSLIKAKPPKRGAARRRDERTYFFADGYYGFDDAVYVAVRLLGDPQSSPQSSPRSATGSLA